MSQNVETTPVELVQFDTRPAGDRFKVGVIRLNRERQVNALTVEMCDAMLAQLQEWSSDESVACVVLCGNGERGFCSGGDVVSVVRAIREGGPRRHVRGDHQFTSEYRLVRAIFEFGKPLVSVMHGITMGAGLGLAVAARHRVVVPGARIAMPESRIGLFPDVGAAWFLGRAPGHCGAFLALAGVTMDAGDAIFAGLADHVVAQADAAHLVERIAQAGFTGEAAADDVAIGRLLASFERDEGSAAASPLAQRFGVLRRIGQAGTVHDLVEMVDRAAEQDAWFREPAANLRSGSPLSLLVGFAHFRRARGASLAAVLNEDLALARAFVRGGEFAEGVRAALIDKDRQPRWAFPTLAAVPESYLSTHYLRPAFACTG